MGAGFQIVVCGSVVPDPLQTLEPLRGPTGWGLKNEMMLPGILDPWAAHAFYEAAHLAATQAGSKVYLVCLGPKAKLQQLMMSIAPKVAFELVPLDGPASGFADAWDVAAVLAEAIRAIPGIERQRLLVFGGCASASRDAGVTLQMVGERLEIDAQFMSVDALQVLPDGALRLHERIEGAQYQVSVCAAPPLVAGWATGHLPEPPNNPQTGMLNMRTILPTLQKAPATPLAGADQEIVQVELPVQRRDTRVIKGASTDEIARDIVAWIRG